MSVLTLPQYSFRDSQERRERDGKATEGAEEEKIQSLQEATDINTLPLLENSSHPKFLPMSTENTPT